MFVLKRTHTNNTSDSLNEENIFRFVSVATLGILSMKSLMIPKGGNQNPYIEEEDNTMAKRKRTKDKQQSTKHAHKTKDQQFLIQYPIYRVITYQHILLPLI